MSTNLSVVLQEFLQNTSNLKVLRERMTPDATYVSLNFSNAELKKVMPWTGTHKGPQELFDVFSLEPIAIVLPRAATALSVGAGIVVFVGGLIPMQVMVRFPELFFHFFVLLVFLDFVFGIRGASRPLINRTEAIVGHSTGRI